MWLRSIWQDTSPLIFCVASPFFNNNICHVFFISERLGYFCQVSPNLLLLIFLSFSRIRSPIQIFVFSLTLSCGCVSWLQFLLVVYYKWKVSINDFHFQDIIHCHDWSSAPVAWLFKEHYMHYGLSKARIVFTIHNLEFGASLIGKAVASSDKATTVSSCRSLRWKAFP